MDRTPPGRPLGGVAVRLEVVERGSSSERRAVTNAMGRFAFNDLPVGGLRVFVVHTAYGGVPYEARVTLTPGTPVRAVEIAVYDPTRDRGAVRGAVAFAAVEPSRGAVRVSVVQRLVNPTERAVVVTPDAPLVFPLPRGAEAVELIGGWRDPRVSDGAIMDAIPVLPGALQVGYSFGVEPRGRRFVWSWALPYGATDVEVLVADPAVRVSGPGVAPAAPVTDGGRRFARWSAGPIPARGRIVLTFDGIPVSGDRAPGAAAGLLAVLLAAGLSLGLARGRSGAA